MDHKADIGVIGLAVMGQNLILNMADHEFTVVVYNRTVSKIDEFLNGAAKGKRNIIGAYSIQEMIEKLERPRKIMLMVKAGKAVDDFIEMIAPLLDIEDIIIDGGNSYYPDTIRRTKYLEDRGLLFIGTGISGGEEGARRGPSIMPGGSVRAWPFVEKIFKRIAAKTPDGSACCDWVGSDGAGHYVKMIHNGIEYGDMQIICEAYHIMRDLLGKSAEQMHSIFSEWNSGTLDSYLVQITSEILAYKDSDYKPLLDKILDTAGQKGTGRWMSESALLLGTPVTLITEAVYARSLSALKEERSRVSKEFVHVKEPLAFDNSQFIADIRNALLASKIISYAQGFMLLRTASVEYGWNLDYGQIALMWRGGCIIRSVFLDKIKEAYERDPSLISLVVDPYFTSLIKDSLPSWRRVVATAVLNGIPVPAFSSALSFFDGYRSEFLPANLLQAQRDYFGAHMYERLDQPRGTFFHTNWTGHGGDVASSTYTV